MHWQVPYSILLVLCYLLQGLYFMQYYRWNKQPYLPYYSLFILCIAIYIILASSPFYNLFLPTTINTLVAVAIPIGTIGFICYYKFLQLFFSTKLTNLHFHRLLNFCILSSILMLFCKYILPNNDYLQDAWYYRFGATIALPIYCYMAYVIFKIRTTYILYFKIGLSCLLIGILLSVIIGYNLDDTQFQLQSLAHIPAQIGMFIEVICTSIAIAKKEGNTINN